MKTMFPYKNASYEINVYNDKDLTEKSSVIEQALSLWHTRCNEYKEKHGDQGTSVLGAGISVYYLPPRCRNYQIKMIIPAIKATKCQGDSVWESSKHEILTFLKSNGIKAYYEAGNMD